MKCKHCVNGVVGIVYAAGEWAEPLYCSCNGEGTVIALPFGEPYVEAAADEDGNGNHGMKCEVHAEAIK